MQKMKPRIPPALARARVWVRRHRKAAVLVAAVSTCLLCSLFSSMTSGPTLPQLGRRRLPSSVDQESELPETAPAKQESHPKPAEEPSPPTALAVPTIIDKPTCARRYGKHNNDGAARPSVGTKRLLSAEDQANHLPSAKPAQQVALPAAARPSSREPEVYQRGDLVMVKWHSWNSWYQARVVERLPDGEYRVHLLSRKRAETENWPTGCLKRFFHAGDYILLESHQYKIIVSKKGDRHFDHQQVAVLHDPDEHQGPKYRWKAVIKTEKGNNVEKLLTARDMQNITKCPFQYGSRIRMTKNARCLTAAGRKDDPNRDQLGWVLDCRDAKNAPGGHKVYDHFWTSSYFILFDNGSEKWIDEHVVHFFEKKSNLTTVPEAEFVSFRTGHSVKLRKGVKLTDGTDYSGRTGKVLSYDPDKKMYTVQLDKPRPEPIRVKPWDLIC